MPEPIKWRVTPEDNSEPSLKPGLNSTTFWMTTITSAVFLVNAALASYDRQPIKVTPELSTLLAFVLVGLYVCWRHINRAIVNAGKAKIEVAKAEAARLALAQKEIRGRATD